MKTSFYRCSLWATALLGLAFIGCDSKSPTPGPLAGPDSAAPEPVSTLTGDIKIEGSSTVLPISNAMKEQFQVQYPDVSVTVGGSGTGNGFNEFAKQSADITGASRPIKAGEAAACRESGVEFIELPVAYDGLTVVVHPENDWADQLTIDQLKTIFVGSDAAKTWKDVDPSWPNDEIKIFAPGVGSGTYDYFHEVLAKEDDASLRGDMTLNEDDNVLVQGVAGNKNSIGFFGVAYYEENKDKLKALAIVNPKTDEAVLPTAEDIASNRYAPLSRPLFIYVNAKSLNKAQVQVFAEFYLENASETAGKVGYVRLPEDILARSKANLDAAKTGTHFVTAEGEDRSGLFTEIFVDANLAGE